MKKFAILSTLFIISACGVAHNLPPETTQTVTHYVDSIAWHDSTVVRYLDKERYVDVVNPMDTLNLETEYAKAEAYLDTSARVLKGSIENKDVPVETKIKWKEKIVYKDSIQIKEVPYPVEVIKEKIKYPKTYWWFLAISLLSLGYFGIKIYLKFKTK
jgi:hypothetical protein